MRFNVNVFRGESSRNSRVRGGERIKNIFISGVDMSPSEIAS